MACTLSLETELWASGHACVAGVDEAGRGPLAGPVTTAAVILPRDFEHAVLTDSKKLTPKVRERLYEELTGNEQILWASDQADEREIDRINILKATHASMARSVAKLSEEPDMVLIDGLEVPGFPFPQKGVVKGDSLSLSIAAASIIAKVERDRLMLKMAETYLGYGFEQHKGYPTKMHLERLQELGPCPIHRQSFGPVSQLTLKLD
jgi:ribonuclease HII